MVAVREVGVVRLHGRRPSAASSAYSHALLMLDHANNPSGRKEAEDVAIKALQQGGHSALAVLAHARHEVLQLAAAMETQDQTQPVAASVHELALQLTATRPAFERSLIDLELRYGLSVGNFAKVLGMPIDQAIRQAQNVADQWASTLDPALMVWLGPGSCPELSELIARHPSQNADSDRGPADSTEPESSALPTRTVDELLELGARSRSHVETCERCQERQRTITTVRTLVGQVPLAVAPASVAATAKMTRRRLVTVPLPPAAIGRTIRRHWVIGTACAVVLCGAVVGVISFPRSHTQTTHAKSTSHTSQVFAPSQLLGTPSIVTASTKTISVANTGSVSILWHASTSAPWLTVSPDHGQLAPTQSVSLVVAVDGASRQLAQTNQAVITITGADGSTQVLRYDATAP